MSMYARVRKRQVIGNIIHSLPKSVSDAMLNDAMKIVRQNVITRSSDPYIPHGPNPGVQSRFLEADDTREILYGGAAGGGKTEALLMSSLKYVHVPGYAAIIFRRTFPMLDAADGLIERSKRWLMNTDAEWHEGKHRWTFPSGATLTFAHLQYDNDVYNHQGAAYQYIGWDEVTQFTRFQYTYLFSRCRRPSDMLGEAALSNVPLRIRGGSNPGGVGHLWVKKRFIEGDLPRGRVYMPASLVDNPKLDRESYIEMLHELDITERKQLLKGDWEATEDGLLSWSAISAARSDNCLWPMGTIAYPHGVRNPELYMGIDIGRTTHNTVIWVWQKIGDHAWCREMLVLHGAKFENQREEIIKRITPNVISVKIDKGGIGMQIAEELEGRFPAQVEGVQLSRGKSGQVAKLMEAYFNRGLVHIPIDDDLDEDLTLVRKTDTVNGVPVVETQEGPSGHADRFWAAGLGLYGIPTLLRRKARSVPRGFKSGHLSQGKRRLK